MANKVIWLAIGLLIASALLPAAFNNWVSSSKGDRTTSFTALKSATETEDFQLALYPVNAATVTVDGGSPLTQLASATDVQHEAGFYLFASTGVVRLASVSSDVGNTVKISENYDRNFGLASGFWPVIPLLAIVPFLTVWWERRRRRRRRG